MFLVFNLTQSSGLKLVISFVMNLTLVSSSNSGVSISELSNSYTYFVDELGLVSLIFTLVLTFANYCFIFESHKDVGITTLFILLMLIGIIEILIIIFLYKKTNILMNMTPILAAKSKSYVKIAKDMGWL